jgi:hypothetical protein
VQGAGNSSAAGTQAPSLGVVHLVDDESVLASTASVGHLVEAPDLLPAAEHPPAGFGTPRKRGDLFLYLHLLEALLDAGDLTLSIIEGVAAIDVRDRHHRQSRWGGPPAPLPPRPSQAKAQYVFTSTA